MEILMGREGEKTKPNKANSKPIASLWAGNPKQGGWGEIPQFGGFLQVKVAYVLVPRSAFRVPRNAEL